MADNKNCAECGTPFEPRRAKQVYCSGACRTRASRKRANTPPAPAAAAGPVAPAAPSAPSDPATVEGIDLVARVRSELEGAGRLNTWIGHQAMVLAQRLRVLSPDTGSSQAAVSKELRLVMAQALQGVAVEGDPIDELAKRREQKMAGVASAG